MGSQPQFPPEVQHHLGAPCHFEPEASQAENVYERPRPPQTYSLVFESRQRLGWDNALACSEVVVLSTKSLSRRAFGSRGG